MKGTRRRNLLSCTGSHYAEESISVGSTETKPEESTGTKHTCCRCCQQPPWSEASMEFLRLILWTYWLSAVALCSLAILPLPPYFSPLQQTIRKWSRRGKLIKSTSTAARAPALAWTVPQQLFTHFYATAVVTSTALLLLAAASASVEGPDKETATVLLLMLLMEAHALRRLYESVFVSRYSPLARMHLVAYLVGITYYVAVPLSLVSVGGSFWKQKLQQNWARLSSPKNGPDVLLLLWRSVSWWQWVGAGVCVWGFLHQYRCHVILASLRRKDDSSSYGIPRGDWFQLVSSPHYLAEIVIYVGLLIVSGGRDAIIWLLLAWVVGNLSVIALETHQWYRQEFKEYPRHRAALVPFFL